MTDRVALNEVVSKEVVTPEENMAAQHEPKNIEGLGFMDNMDYHRVADGLDVEFQDRNDPQLADQLAYLMDYAKETTGKEDRLDLILAIKSIKKSLGWTETGKTAIKKLYQWTRLDTQRRTIEKKMEIYA